MLVWPYGLFRVVVWWGGGGCSETFEHNFMMIWHMYYKSERGINFVNRSNMLGELLGGGIPVPPPTPLLYATLLVMFMFTTVHVG